MAMKPRKLALAFASAALLTLALTGCGGGGGGSSGGGGGGSGGTSSISLSGVAATGAAFTDATITVTDSTGATVGSSSAPVGADGTYTITLSAGAVAPFVLTASRTSADGAVESLVSVVPSTSGATATVNITPVTDLIASRLSSSGDPLKLTAELAAGTTTINDTTVASKVDEVQAILGPILTATGTSSTNPLTGSFTVDGTGYDRLLDSIKVTIIPSSATTANIEVGIKQQLAEGTDPVSIQFTSQTVAANIPAIPVIDPTTLVESGTAAFIAQHLAQLNTCFALPLTSRITSGGTTAADIQATECKNAFFGNNPATFKSNGNIVGKGKAFNGIFVDGATGLVFSQGTYEFTRGNGDIVIGYKSRTVAGNETFDTFALRKDTDGQLKQIGNQYAYPGGVAAYQQFRQFLTLNQSAFNYHSTGYTLNVNHYNTGGAGTDGSIFDRVVVTAPSGATLTLKPKTGISYLGLVKGGTSTLSTNFVRLSSVFADPATTGDISLKDPSLFFASTPFDDNALALIPAQSVWKFDYYLASAPGTIAATQHYKTRARALTIAELKLKSLAQLSAADITYIQANADATFGTVPIGSEPNVTLDYSVPTGALPPTGITVWGGYSTGQFNDSASLGSTARTGTILCSKTGVGDTHCSGATGSPYASSAYITGGHLWARDPAGREYASFYAMYKLQP